MNKYTIVFDGQSKRQLKLESAVEKALKNLKMFNEPVAIMNVFFVQDGIRKTFGYMVLPYMEGLYLTEEQIEQYIQKKQSFYNPFFAQVLYEVRSSDETKEEIMEQLKNIPNKNIDYWEIEHFLMRKCISIFREFHLSPSEYASIILYYREAIENSKDKDNLMFDILTQYITMRDNRSKQKNIQLTT